MNTIYLKSLCFSKQANFCFFLFIRVGCLSFVTMCIFCSGCATPAYVKDRFRDAADIVTITTGAGVGGAGKVGPIQAGMLLQWGEIGLRGGEFTSGTLETAHVITTVIPFKTANTNIAGIVFGVEAYTAQQTGMSRGKGFVAVSMFPFITTDLYPSTYVDIEGKVNAVSPGPYPFYYYSQIEIYIGAIWGVRVGVNPGEIIDFVLGWATIDLFNDDLEMKKRRKTDQGR